MASNEPYAAPSTWVILSMDEGRPQYICNTVNGPRVTTRIEVASSYTTEDLAKAAASQIQLAGSWITARVYDRFSR